MLTTHHSFIPTVRNLLLLHVQGHGRKPPSYVSSSSFRCAKKGDLSEDSEPRQSDGATLPWLKVPLSPLLITQSALAVFGLGFIDAGYSGDWSRIGVISKEAEDLLKVAAFIVVPLCIFAIISISKQQDN
ncbi:hypothetical protein SAY86_016871 [Trapa natans]|uniref:DUF7887 domain-containing protein n=1 Tax=Trapa natans TaxID=22666 RepID=A0AAN7LPI5_TRANT|nr:hypothetical protein SAY86_016871 [Trapa natans]